ncbi:TPA: DegT/DnrJ/EryC1/StrS family aminotransferase [bacterium]|nr:DegT/DnrJ/EryC1/StrS family aminotransferase [bacterium]
MSKLAIDGGKPTRTKPFPAWPIWDETEINALKEVLESGIWGIGGNKVSEFEHKFSSYVGAKFGICVTSGTTALEIALRAGNIGHGDEVIVPPYTFMATASSVLMSNAVPIFADIDPETYNIDPNEAEKVITERTKAIIPVHIGGCPADMDAIMDIAKKHNLVVIEDCAQAHAGEWKGQKVGTIGDMGCFSFQSSKNLCAGEGGIITTNNEKYADRCWSYHNCGRVRQGAWYEHQVLGSNLRMTQWQAGILLAQMERLKEQTETRNRNALYLAEKLSEIDGITPLKRDDRVTCHAYHLFIFKYDSSKFADKPRSEFLQALSAEGIPCSGGYNPLYKDDLFKAPIEECPLGCGYYKGKVDYSKVYCPETEKACQEEGVWLFQSMFLGDQDDMDDIVNAIKKVKENFCN